ncbi:MAG: hypothetical protein H7330_11055, partial [Hymenobacteraceae bacterium]|nr:hypothetical protein [Hymenobacteraceae bacterium]
MKPSSFLLSLLALLGLALTTHSAAAQQLQGARWFFGERVGIDFTTGAPRFERGGQTQYFDATGSSVCDAAGRLQFYTDGWRVWNRRHQLMPNGVILPYPGYDKGLTTLTVPVQGKPWLYRVFQMASVSVADPRQITNRQSAAGAFGYFTVDMHRNGGRGDVVPDTGRAPLHIGISNALTAMIGPLGNTWVVAHASIGDAFYAWLVTEQGVEPPVVSHAGIAFDSAFAGTYPNGDRYGGADFNAISLKAAHSSELVVLTVNQRGLTQLFPFDVRTGTVGSLRQQILEDRVTGPFNPPLPPGIVYADTTVEAAALSTDLRYLYVNVWQPWLLRPGWRGVAYQYDLTA